MDTVLLSVLFGGAMAPIARADSASDAALAGRGDRQAFARLVERHQRAVYGLTARILGAGDDAREAAQVAFVRAWERRASFDPERDFCAWVLGIARNAAVDRLRHAGRLEALGESADDGQAADEALHARRTEVALDEAVAALPPIYREAVELAYVQGRTVAQIAQILQTPPGTVMARLFRARRLLRARLGDAS